MASNPTPYVSLIGSYVPRKCGIATFTHDLATAIAQDVYGSPLESGDRVDIVAVTDRDGEYDYPPQVSLEIGQHRKEDYRNAADVLNHSRTDVVCLQHEYGIFGGADGDYILELLRRLRKPLVTTLHTVLAEPSPGQRAVLQEICERSASVVVMAERAFELLPSVYGVSPDKVKLVHHGTPDVVFADTEPFKERFGLSGRRTIMTFGLLSPNKGIETMLRALTRLAPDYPDLAYMILGVTHPHVRRESGESYRLYLESQAVAGGIENNVIFHNRYVSLDDLCEYLQAADVYVTPYRGKEQIVSGTLAYALATGRAIVSTPYYYAQELLAQGRGCLFDFDDDRALEANLRELLAHDDLRQRVRQSAYDYGRNMIWPKVGEEYIECFQQGIEQSVPTQVEEPLGMRLSVPQARLDHLLAMTDGTGILQHAIFSVPNRFHGYTTDDNARALVVANMAWTHQRDESILPYLQSYLSFLHYSFNEQNGRFRNFMSYDRQWLEQSGTDDCQGRSLWSLGYLIGHAPTTSLRMLALQLFEQGLPAIGETSSPRSWAFAILGLIEALSRDGSDLQNWESKQTAFEEQLSTLAAQLLEAHQGFATPEWPWFESTATYENGRLPEALLLAGAYLDDEEMINRGVTALDWLMGAQTSEHGVLSVIGNDGWFHRGERRARYDQQPVEAAALIGACRAAFEITGEARWLQAMRCCFEWYLGRNDIGQWMIDFKTRGCYDGLCGHGVNQNQGAEAVVSWLMSLFTMHEMQSVQLDIIEGEASESQVAAGSRQLASPEGVTS